MIINERKVFRLIVAIGNIKHYAYGEYDILHKVHVMKCPINVNFKTCSSETIDNKINIQIRLRFLLIKTKTKK